jgi:hypothetical protein
MEQNFGPHMEQKMRHLVRFLRQRLVVEFARGVGVEREVELINPAELERAKALLRANYA